MKGQDRAVLVWDRLKDELGYTSALPWSIFAASPRRAGASLLACCIGALNYPAASCGVSARRDKNVPEGVTPECINRGSSLELAWIPA